MMTEPTAQPTPADDSDADDTTIEDSALDPRTREAFKKLRSENHSLRTRLRRPPRGRSKVCAAAPAPRSPCRHRRGPARSAAQAARLEQRR